MSKEIREIPYHLYLGSQFQTKGANGEWSKTQILTTYTLHDIVSYYKSETRLILRKLSSMTEEEAVECLKLMNQPTDAMAVKHMRSRILEYAFGIMYWSKIVPYLLSKGFDLFNLIEKGLALDSDSKQ